MNFVDLSEMVSGTVHIYIQSGVEGCKKVYGEDAEVDFPVNRRLGSDTDIAKPDIEKLKKTADYTIQLFTDHRSDTSYLECWGAFSGDNTYFLMAMPIVSIEEGAEISRRFLIGVSLVVMFVGSIAVYLVTDHITAPINDIARISERMSAQDFSVKYTGKDKNEIGILGTSMNEMSDKLELAINELKEANAKLREDIDAKTRIDEMRKEFIADVSYELKTPISIIEGYAEGLVEGMAEDKDTRDYYCEVIMDEAVKMNKMVRQLTSLINYEFQDNVNECTVFDLSELIRSVSEASAMRMEESGAAFALEIPDNCAPALVEADEFKIEEVYTNYLSNAINHLDGERRIRTTISDGGDDWIVSVYNDGEPIPDESLEKLWDKFYKVDKSRSRAYGGSGIGLSIVKAIMDSHNGSYAVENVDSGVRFEFRLKKHV